MTFVLAAHNGIIMFKQCEHDVKETHWEYQQCIWGKLKSSQ